MDRLSTQGIGLRPQPRAPFCRPVGPVRIGSATTTFISWQRATAVWSVPRLLRDAPSPLSHTLSRSLHSRSLLTRASHETLPKRLGPFLGQIQDSRGICLFDHSEAGKLPAPPDKGAFDTDKTECTLPDESFFPTGQGQAQRASEKGRRQISARSRSPTGAVLPTGRAELTEILKRRKLFKSNVIEG